MTNPLRPPRGTTASITARVLLDGELAFNTDTDRLHVGDGATLGGKICAPVEMGSVTVAFSTPGSPANATRITVTAKDPAGATLAGVHEFILHMSESAAGLGLTADTYSGDLAAVSGAIIGTLTSKKAWVIQTGADGVWIGTLVASAQPADQYAVVKLPFSTGVSVSGASGTNWNSP